MKKLETEWEEFAFYSICHGIIVLSVIAFRYAIFALAQLSIVAQ